MTLWACQGCQICGFWGSGTHRLSLISLDTIVHRPRKMVMEDMVNVCTCYILFHWSVCLFEGL